MDANNKQHDLLADKIVTVGDIMRYKPCQEYPEERIRALIGSGKTVLEILDLPIPASDRVWALTRPSILPDATLHAFGVRCAEAVLHVWEQRYPDDNRPRRAIETKRRWMRGDATDRELLGAEGAAHAAAVVADLASEAAEAAGDDAAVGCELRAYDAAISAGYAASRYPDHVSDVRIHAETAIPDRYTARRTQLRILRELITGGHDETSNRSS